MPVCLSWGRRFLIAPSSTGSPAGVGHSPPRRCRAGRSICTPLALDVGERLARDQARLLLGQALPAHDGRIDVEWIEFHAITSPPRALCGEQGCPAAEKRVEDD